MANVFQKKEKGNYHYRFQHNGHPYTGSTYTANYNTAIKFLNEKLNEVKRSGGVADLFSRLLQELHKMNPSDQEKLRRDFASQLLHHVSRKLKLNDAWSSYLNSPKKNNPQADHLKRVESKWKCFLDWRDENYPNIEYLSEVNEGIAIDYMHSIYEKGLSNNTYNKYLSAVSTVFDTVKNKAGLSENVWRQVDRLSNEPESREPFSLDQLNQIVNIATGEIRVLILIGFYSGLRLGDCASLKWKQIDLLEGRIYLLQQSKSKKVANIKMMSVLQESISTLPKTDEYLLPKAYELHRKGMLDSRFKKIFKEAGIETTRERTTRGKNKTCTYGFHSLRHTFISMLHSAGVPQMIAQMFVGHGNEATHKIYQHGLVSEFDNALERLPPIGESNG